MYSLEKPTETSRIAIINPDLEVLLLRRPLTSKSRPGEWDFPGGRMDPGETPRIAGVRECLEETGIELNSIDCQPLFAVTDDDNGRKFSRFYLVAALAAPEEPDLTEHTESAWISVDRADRLLTFGHHLRALQIIKYLH